MSSAGPMPQSLRDHLEARKARDRALEKERTRRERRRDSEARLYAARTASGHIDLRFGPYVRLKRRGGPVYLRGQAVGLVVPEVIDAWELLGDMYRFLKAWRPMRLRTEPQQVATRALFEQWDRLGAVVEPGRWA